MGRRVVAGAAALGLAVGLGVVALLVATGGGDDPVPLPVLGAGRAAMGAAEPAVDSSAPASITYEVDGTLDELSGDARAWWVGTDVELDRVVALAGALDLDGEVHATPAGWEVSDGASMLDVQRQPGLPWSFSAVGGGGRSSGSSGAAGPGSPDEAVAGEGGGGAAGAADGKEGRPPVSYIPPMPSPSEEIVCDMPECPPGTACVQVCPPEQQPVRIDLPSREEAEERAAGVFAAAGVDVQAAEVRADRYGSWMVSADPEVGGLPTVGMASTVTIGAAGVIDYAGGWLAAPERGDAYPLIGTSEALRRLAQERSAPLADGREPAIDCIDCPEVEPVVVTLVGVRLGLQLVPAYDVERSWLVPSYLFESRDGGPGPDLVTLAVGDDDLVAPPDPLPVDPVLPVDPSPAGPPVGGGGAGCVAVISASVAGSNQPPELEVCQAGPARAGEVVVFELVASDPDSGIRDDCGSPVVAFGDEDGVGVCDIGCVSLAPGPGELRRTYEHVYAKPGTYTATFTLAGCGPDDPGMSASLAVTVTG